MLNREKNEDWEVIPISELESKRQEWGLQSVTDGNFSALDNLALGMSLCVNSKTSKMTNFHFSKKSSFSS